MCLMAVRSTRRGPFRSLEEKLAIVEEYESAPAGQRGEVVRRHNLGRSTVGRWAYARDHDEFGVGRTGRRTSGGGAMTPKKQSVEIVRLRRELAAAQADQEVLKAALESAGKAHALLEKLAKSAEPEPLKEPSVNRPSSLS